MKCIVCVKQVPDTANVEVDPVTGVLKRDGTQSKLNPYDLYAMESALGLKEQLGYRGCHHYGAGTGQGGVKGVYVHGGRPCGTDQRQEICRRRRGGYQLYLIPGHTQDGGV